MALIRCPECGKEVSDKTEKCIYCGYPIQEMREQEETEKIKKIIDYNLLDKLYESENGNRDRIVQKVQEITGCSLKSVSCYIDGYWKEVYPEYKNKTNVAKNESYIKNASNKKKKDSKLSIWAAICAFFGCTSFIGLILAIVDLSKKDKSTRHIGSWFAIIVFVLYIIMIGSTNNSSKNTTIDATQKTVNSVEQSTKEVTSESTPEEKDNEIEVGDSFENNGLKITLNEANIDFADYDNEYGWNTPDDGMKYIMASFTFENNSDSDKYVSIYDFDCYADNTTCDQEYGLDNSDFINTNISTGRNVSFKVYFAVPIDSQSIELEYETNAWSNEKVIIKLQ